MFIRLIAAVIFAAGLLAAATSTSAQDAAPPQSAEQGSADRRTELANRLLRAMDLDKAVSVTIQAMPEILADEMSGLPDAERQEAMAALDEVMAEVLPGFLDRFLTELVPVYAATFTEAEMEHMLAFYDTPMGRTILEKSYGLGVQTELAMQAALPQTMREMAIGLCSRLKCDPQEMMAAMGVQ